MTAHLNQCLKNGYRLVKISNGKNSKKFTTRINGYYFDKHGYCGRYRNVQNVSKYNQEVNASILEFIDNLDEYIEWCDFAICRCGAGTLSEISQKKRGMIMIPLPESIDNHQYFNAVFYEENNQGKIFQEKDSLDSLSYLLRKTIHEKIYQNWKKKEPPIDHSRAASLMLGEIHKDNAAI